MNIIIKCVSTTSYLVNLNGMMSAPSHPSRGLREGDLLNPFLFLVRSERFSFLMHLVLRESILCGVKASHSGPQISHYFLSMISFFLEKQRVKGRCLKKYLERV